jgi:DNA repair protein RadD
MSAPDLRPYQRDFKEEFFRAVTVGCIRRILGVAPTGGGKTVMFADIIRTYVGQRKTVLVLAHTREIIGQTSKKLSSLDVVHGIIMAGTQPRPFENVQVAAIQTLHRRAIGSDKMQLPPADLLVIDEAHHCPAATYRKIIDAFPNAVVLGLTATPCRGDGRGLGGIFELIIECPQVPQLIEQGYLVRTRCYAPVDPNLKGIKTVAGDYSERQLAERMDQAQLIGDIVTHWHKFGERRKTVAFAVNVEHSIHLRDEFIKSGVRAEHIDGSTPKAERDATLTRLASGDIELVTNCMVLTEGWDMPDVGCCILARPTKKMGLYRQMIGRVLRPADGKTDAIVLDHSGAVYRHGFVEDPVVWTLDPDKKAENLKHASFSEHSRVIECSQCSAMRVAGEACWHCGFLPQRKPRYIGYADGELGEVGRDGRAGKNHYDREQWNAMLLYIAEECGYKPGWAAYQYKQKFGAFPPWGAKPGPIEPSHEVRSWVRSRQIAFAKGRQSFSHGRQKAAADG